MIDQSLENYSDSLTFQIPHFTVLHLIIFTEHLSREG